MKLEVFHLMTGWSDPGFEENIQGLINTQLGKGWLYHDIKVSSKDNNCLVIFRKS